MQMYDIIVKKKRGNALSKEEISFLVSEYVAERIPDYQMSAFLMAVCFQEMTDEEAAYLTEAIVASGDTINLRGVMGRKVDKHSTGGVGDKTSLVVAPVVAACGLPVAKMSGRGLGHTGGTIDKLESIEGFQSQLTKEQFIQQIDEIGIALIAQTQQLAPADKKLYALRDVTATVDSIPLIASSIMSKKIAGGADAIVLDVKVGNGAFMKTIEQAETLAELMVKIGRQLGKRTVAVISDMNQPLGQSVGNSLEVIEALEVLRGNGPKDVRELSTALAVEMILLGKIVRNKREAESMVDQVIANGSALQVFYAFLAAQGVPKSTILGLEDHMPKAQYVIPIKSEQTGYVTEILTEEVGRAAVLLGAGRRTKDDVLDLYSGVRLYKKLGEHVNSGELLGEIFANNMHAAEQALAVLKRTMVIGPDQVAPQPLVHKIITCD